MPISFAKKAILLACALSAQALHAQLVPCILYTPNNDTLVGRARFKEMITLQNEGFHFVGRDKAEADFKPSEVKEAFIFPTVFDTLHLISVPKTFVAKYSEAKVLAKATDSHLLIHTDPGKGPLQVHTLFTGIDSRSVMSQNGTFYRWEKYLFTTFASLDYRWTLLPDIRYDRTEVLIKLLADCPLLVEKLKKKRIDPMKKMPKILRTYNHCKTQ